MKKALVTGATGFLGGRLAQRLTEEGWDVTAVGRQADKGLRLRRQGIRFVQADLRDRERIAAACVGQRAVFHCGALSASWGAYSAFHESNVLGTEHVIAGCLRHGVERLIHVSTPSVCFGGGKRCNVSERDALPRRQASAYAATKRLAEGAVLRACGQGLRAIVFRPRALFGPGDGSILPKLIEANATTGIPLIDNGTALVDLTYVDNAVDALILGERAPETLSGRIYHISGGEPIAFGEAVRRLFGKLGEPVRFKAMPYWAAYAVAALMEGVARVLPGDREPLLTRATVGMIGRSQTLDISLAVRELGYKPRVSVETGMDKFAAWWRSRGEGWYMG